MLHPLRTSDIYLHAIATARGSWVEHNDTATLGMPAAQCERLVKKTGVRSRPVAGPGQYTSDLAFAAALRLLADHPSADVGALIVCTQTPDHLIPGVSSRLHGLLGLPADCFVMDINQGCSGFVLGAQTMAGLLTTLPPGKDAILVNADTYTRLLRQDDLSTRVLFGDAAAASLFSTRPQGLRLRCVRSWADGTGYDAFVAQGSALRPADDQAGIHMDGAAILNFALKVVPAAIEQVLADNGLDLRQIRRIVFHQANSFVTGQLSRKLGLSSEQAPENCAELGNTVSASVPLLLAEQMPLLERGDLVATVGFGVGLSWGVALFEQV